MHEEGKSIINLVHIMLQVNVTFSLKFCNLGCFSNSFVSYLLLSNGSCKNYQENNRPSAAGAISVSGLIQLFLALSLVDWSFSAKFKLKCKNAEFQ